MDDVIELRQLLKLLLRKIWFITSITIVLTLIASVGSLYLLKPKYEATTDLLVNSAPVKVAGQQGATISQNDITSNLMLIQTYMTVIVSPRIMQPSAQKLGIPMDTLTKQVTVDNVKDSQVLTIHAEDANPAQAVTIANTVADVFKSQIATLMQVDNVNVLTPAQVAKQVWPRPLLTGAIAFLFGLIVSIGSVLLREYLDTRLRTEELIEKHLGLPVLGKVPVISKLSVQEQMPKQMQTPTPPLTLEPGGNEV